MAPNDWHDLNGYRFRETLHGPMVGRECVQCGGFCVATPEYPDPRCEVCMQAHYGVMRAHERMTTYRLRRARWLDPYKERQQ